jgi:hypothetical protein
VKIREMPIATMIEQGTAAMVAANVAVGATVGDMQLPAAVSTAKQSSRQRLATADRAAHYHLLPLAIRGSPYDLSNQIVSSRGPHARGGIHKPERPSRSQPARQCGSTLARPSKMPSIRRLRRRLLGRSLHHQRNPRAEVNVLSMGWARKVRFAIDSPVEGEGFEHPVPS